MFVARTLLASACLMLVSFAAHAQGAEDRQCPTDVPDAQLLACARQLPARSSGAVLAFANLGSRAYDRGDLQIASMHYLRTLPKEIIIDIRLHTRRGFTFFRTGRYDFALDDARLAYGFLKGGVEWDGGPRIAAADRKWIFPLLVDIFVSLKAPEAAEAAEGYLALPPAGWGDRMERGNVLSQLGRYKEALVEIDAAIKDQPTRAILKSNKCLVLIKLARPIEAVNFCEAAVAAEPNNYVFLGTLTEAYTRTNQCDKARATLKKAREQFPDSVVLKRDVVCPAPAS